MPNLWPDPPCKIAAGLAVIVTPNDLRHDLPEMLKSDAIFKLDRLYAIRVPPSCIS
jgi:hypothetical protein